MYHESIEGISAVYSRKWGIPSMQGALVEYQISNNQPLAHTDFLWGAYKPSCWWFECFELLRKFCLVGLPVLTRQGTDEDSHIEDAYGMLAVVLSLVVYTVGDPYSKQADKLLQIPVQVDLLLFLICGMLLNFAANHEGASAAMEVAVSVLIIGTCAPLFLVLVWAVIDPHTIDAWAESSTVLTKMRAQAAVVVNQDKQMARLMDGGRGGWRGPRFLESAPAPPTDDIRPGKHGLLWVLRWVSECFDEDQKQGKLDLAGQQDPDVNPESYSKFHMRIAFCLFPVLEKEVALFNLRNVQRPAGDDDLTQHEQHKLEASLRKVFTKAAFDVAVISARLPRKHLPRNHASDEESAFAQQLELMGSISTVLKRGAAPEERGTGREHSSHERGRGWSVFGGDKQGPHSEALGPGPREGGTWGGSNPMHPTCTEDRNTHHASVEMDTASETASNSHPPAKAEIKDSHFRDRLI